MQVIRILLYTHTSHSYICNNVDMHRLISSSNLHLRQSTNNMVHLTRLRYIAHTNTYITMPYLSIHYCYVASLVSSFNWLFWTGSKHTDRYSTNINYHTTIHNLNSFTLLNRRLALYQLLSATCMSRQLLWQQY